MNFNLNPTQKIIAIVIGLVLTAIGIFFGFRVIFSRASGQEPQAVQVANITQSSAQITWTSGDEVLCTVQYGTSETSLSFFAPESTETTQHAVDLTLLSPSTPYFFNIKCGDREYENGENPWTFTTLGEQPQPTAIPSPTPTVPPPSPTPTVSSSSTSNCPTTLSCEEVEEKLGQGCTTIDLLKCRNRATPTP